MPDGYPEAYSYTCTLGLHQVQRANGYCKECAKCLVCSNPLTAVEYDWALRSAANASQPPEFRHPACFKDSERILLSNESVSIPRELFDRLNAARLLRDPLEDLNIRTNEQDADIQAQRWIHESAQGRSFEDHAEYLYVAMRRMETIAACLSLAVSKSRRSIEVDLSQRELRSAEKAFVEREKHKQKAPHTFQARLTKEISKENKFVKALMAQTGVSEEEAKAIIESQRLAKVARLARQTDSTTTPNLEEPPTDAIN